MSASVHIMYSILFERKTFQEDFLDKTPKRRKIPIFVLALSSTEIFKEQQSNGSTKL